MSFNFDAYFSEEIGVRWVIETIEPILLSDIISDKILLVASGKICLLDNDFQGFAKRSLLFCRCKKMLDGEYSVENEQCSLVCKGNNRLFLFTKNLLLQKYGNFLFNTGGQWNKIDPIKNIITINDKVLAKYPVFNDNVINMAKNANGNYCKYDDKSKCSLYYLEKSADRSVFLPELNRFLGISDPNTVIRDIFSKKLYVWISSELTILNFIDPTENKEIVPGIIVENTGFAAFDNNVLVSFAVPDSDGLVEDKMFYNSANGRIVFDQSQNYDLLTCSNTSQNDNSCLQIFSRSDEFYSTINPHVFIKKMEELYVYRQDSVLKIGPNVNKIIDSINGQVVNEKNSRISLPGFTLLMRKEGEYFVSIANPKIKWNEKFDTGKHTGLLLFDIKTGKVIIDDNGLYKNVLTGDYWIKLTNKGKTMTIKLDSSTRPPEYFDFTEVLITDLDGYVAGTRLRIGDEWKTIKTDTVTAVIKQ